MRRTYAPPQTQAADPEALIRTRRAATPDSPRAEHAVQPNPVHLTAGPRPAHVVALSRAIGNRATGQLLQRSWTDDLLGAASGILGGQTDEEVPQGNNPIEIPEVVIPVEPGGGEPDAEMPESSNPVEIPEVVIPAEPGGGEPDAEMPESNNPVEIPEVVIPVEPGGTSGGGLWNQTAGAASEWFSGLW